MEMEENRPGEEHMEVEVPEQSDALMTITRGPPWHDSVTGAVLDAKAVSAGMEEER